MASANSFRPFLYLLVGLAVGGAGAVLFRDSLTGPKGSPEEQVADLENKLKKAETRLATLEGTRGRRSARNVTDGFRDLTDSVAAGDLVSPDDILKAFQPVIHGVSPIFDRIRAKQEKRHIDSMVSELTRKYDLSPSQQEALHGWFQQRIDENAKRFSDLAGQPGTTVATLAREAKGQRVDVGLDGFMEGMLSGEKLANFKVERLSEKSDRVQWDADMRVERVDSIVKLDEAQRVQVFGIMARGSPEYVPEMELGGAVGDRNQEMLSVLRPEQLQAWEAEKQKRRIQTQQEMAEIGMAMPRDWDPLEDY